MYVPDQGTSQAQFPLVQTPFKLQSTFVEQANTPPKKANKRVKNNVNVFILLISLLCTKV